MKQKRLVASWLALGVFSSAVVMIGAGVMHAQPASELSIALVATDPRLADARSMATDGSQLYVAAGRSIVSVPITGGTVVNLYENVSPCCIAGLTRLGSDLFWVDPNGDSDATAVFRAPTFGGAVEKIFPAIAAESAIVDGADITNDGTRLYTTDQFQGAIHGMPADGSSVIALGTRYSVPGSDHASAILSRGDLLYVADSGTRPDIVPPGVLVARATGGPFTTIFTGPPFVRLNDIEAANEILFVADPGANTIWTLPAAGGSATPLASGPPFLDIRALAYWDNALYVADSAAIYRIDLPNAPPIAADDWYSVDENGTISVPAAGVLANDVDGAGESLTVGLVDGPAAAEGSVTLNHDGSFTFTPATGFAGDTAFRYRASDGKSESNIASATIKVKHAPAVTWANPASIAYGVSLGSAQLNATATVEGTFAYTPAAGTVLDAGGQVLSVLFTPSDTANYSPVTHSVTINVTKAPTTASLTLSKSPQQYSDLETFKATVASTTAGSPIAEGVTFMVGTQVMGTAPLTWNGTGYEGVLADVPLLEPYPPTGQMQPTPLGRTARAVFNNVSGNYLVSSPTRTLAIGKEDARAALSGTQLVVAGADGVAVVKLSALVKDISATDEAGVDTHGGDIRHAPVLFINRDTGMAISPARTVTLVDASDTSTGIATYDWPVNIGAANAQTFRVGIMIDKYFVRYNSADDLLVTVAKPLASRFISGGGHLVLTSSGGLKAGDPLSRNDFGFAVTYKGSGSSSVGHFNTIVRSNGVYQIKGSITSIVVSGTTARLSGSATIYDVTNGSRLVDDRARFDVSLTDAGESGSSDTIAITVRNGAGAVWFSSSSNGTATIEQLLGGGNVSVR